MSHSALFNVKVYIYMCMSYPSLAVLCPIGEQTHGLDWKEVVCELDHPGFLVTSKKGFMLLVQGLLRGLLITNDAFPIHCILHGWSNTEGQACCLTNQDFLLPAICLANHYRPGMMSEVEMLYTVLCAVWPVRLWAY